jgi:hypothetical protein
LSAIRAFSHPLLIWSVRRRTTTCANLSAQPSALRASPYGSRRRTVQRLNGRDGGDKRLACGHDFTLAHAWNNISVWPPTDVPSAEAQLTHLGERWALKVSPPAFDVLLDGLPCGFSVCKYNWMRDPLYVEWSQRHNSWPHHAA